jgi:hypothetical protein
MEDLFKSFAEELELRKARDPFANFPSKQTPSAKDKKAEEITDKMRERAGRQGKLESDVKAGKKPSEDERHNMAADLAHAHVSNKLGIDGNSDKEIEDHGTNDFYDKVANKVDELKNMPHKDLRDLHEKVYGKGDK